MMYLNWIIQGSIVALISLIGYLLRKSITDKLDKFDHDLTSFREEMLKEYVRKEDFTANTAAHKELWQEINEIKINLTKIGGKYIN